MSGYTPTTDEVETAFHEFASDLESRGPGTYPEAPEFADWREAMVGFRRWLAAHDAALRAEWEAEAVLAEIRANAAELLDADDDSYDGSLSAIWAVELIDAYKTTKTENGSER